jgi:YgiT-type zinc finger domain-containing protein
MHEGHATIPFLTGERVVIIKSVPAEICSECCEAYMKSSVVARVEYLLDRVEEHRAGDQLLALPFT